MRFYKDDQGNYYAVDSNGKGGVILYDISFVGRLRADSVQEKDKQLILQVQDSSKIEKINISKVFTEEIEGTVF